MQTRQIKYFLAVAKWGSFSAAAEHISIAQPALSTQIAKLEDQLGCALFVRNARGIELTPAGVRFQLHAIEIWEKIEFALKDASLFAGRSGQQVTIGLPTLTSTLLIAPLIEAGRKRFPLLAIKVHEAMGATLRNMLADNQLDLAILYKEPNEIYAEESLLFEEPLFLGALDRVANWRGKTIPAMHLTKLPLVLSTSGNSHRAQLEDFARREKKSLNIIAEVDSINGQRELVLKGVGATVFPKSGFVNWDCSSLRIARIVGGELMSRAYLVSSRTRANPAAAAAEVLIRSVIRELIKRRKWPGARNVLSH